ncbi:hypothetical protein DN402_05380 [Streptomyces sp. SW4]|nr:hypothetical protein DN402_05380 [Streptomyces sp. SW4]
MPRPNRLASVPAGVPAGVFVLLAGAMTVTACAAVPGAPSARPGTEPASVKAAVQAGPGAAPAASGDVNPVATKAEVRALTADWKGDRFPDGRPRVSDDLLKRMKVVSIEQAWGYLKEKGYTNQFAGDWQMIHEDGTIVGRALTAQYMPSNPGLEKRMTDAGHAAGNDGQMNTWPIEKLQKGDVYVADGFGKVQDGTLIGGNLGSTIHQKTGNGVVFDGTLRDLEELEDIKGFNAFVRGWHPSYIQEVMLTGVNGVTRIGEAVVLPGTSSSPSGKASSSSRRSSPRGSSRTPRSRCCATCSPRSGSPTARTPPAGWTRAGTRSSRRSRTTSSAG